MKLKKILLATLAFALVFTYSCTKTDDASTPGNTGNNNDPLAEVGAVPSTFTKKVLIEKYTGEWCVNCPDGAAVLKSVLDANPEHALAAEVHQGDWLELPQLTTLKTHLGGIGGYPRASIDRVPAEDASSQDGMVVYSRGYWPANTSRLAATAAEAGLAIVSKLNGNALDIKVFTAGKTDISGDVRLTVYILEDNIVAKSQVGGSAGYTHHHVLRKVVSAGLGDPITVKAGQYSVKEYKGVDVSPYNKANVKVLAFINVVGASSTQHRIVNAQETEAGQTHKW